MAEKEPERSIQECMLRDDDVSVIALLGIVAKRMNDAVERGVHLGSGGGSQVEADVDVANTRVAVDCMIGVSKHVCLVHRRSSLVVFADVVSVALGWDSGPQQFQEATTRFGRGPRGHVVDNVARAGKRRHDRRELSSRTQSFKVLCCLRSGHT